MDRVCMFSTYKMMILNNTLPSMIVFLSVIAIACFAVKDPRALALANQVNISSPIVNDSQDSQDTFPTVHVTCVALKQCALCTC